METGRGESCQRQSYRSRKPNQMHLHIAYHNKKSPSMATSSLRSFGWHSMLSARTTHFHAF